MKIAKIYEILDEISPFSLQDSWDNSGLLLGCIEDEFEKIYVGMDIDFSMIKSLEHNALIILHHPLIFSGLKTLNPAKFPSKLLFELIKKDIKVIAMHLNIDKTHMNKYLVQNILGYKISKCSEYECYFEVNMSFEDFAKDVANKLGIEYIRVSKAKDFIKTAALCTGGAGSLYDELEAVDCFLTGDIKYHLAMQAREENVSLIDINHYESEIYFGEIMKKELESKGINAIIANSKNPFKYLKGNK